MTTPTDPLTAAVSRQAADLAARLAELRAAAEGASVVDRIRVLQVIADAAHQFDVVLAGLADAPGRLPSGDDAQRRPTP